MSLLQWPLFKRVAETSVGSVPTDEDLLAGFLDRREERAFEELIHRHTRLVYGTAIRIVRDRHAAEDIFQATFLVLARDGRKIRRRGSLPAWLHRVALQLSKRSLRRSRKLLALEIDPEALLSDPLHSMDAAVTAFNQQVLDEELQRLPAQYREPLVLHFLEGLTNQDTARVLGVTAAAVEGRIKRGKKQLQVRLAQRGVGLGMALTAVSWSQSAAQAAVGGSFVQAALAGGVAVAQGVPYIQIVSPEAVHLAIQETAMLTSGKAAVVAAGLALTAGAGWLGATGMGEGPGVAISLPLDTALADGTGAENGALRQLAQTPPRAPEQLSIVTGTPQLFERVKAEYPELKVHWDDRTYQMILQGPNDRIDAALKDPELAKRPTAEEIGVMRREHRERLAGPRPLSRELEERGLTFVPTEPDSLAGEWVNSEVVRKLDAEVTSKETHTTLALALEILAKRHGINLIFNFEVRKELGLTQDRTVLIPAGTRPLKALLQEVLSPSNLTYTLRGENVHVVRKAVATGPESSPAANVNEVPTLKLPVSPRRSPAEQRIEAALNREAAFQFDQVTLREALIVIQDQQNIPILLDDREIDGDYKVSLKVPALPLKRGLKLLLEGAQNAKAIVEDDVVKVTSADVVNNKLVTRIYDVRQLGDETAYYQIPEVVRAGTSAEWREQLPPAGGGVSGQFSAASNPNGGTITVFNHSLIVRQTLPVHEEIESLLTQLLEQSQAVPPPGS